MKKLTALLTAFILIVSLGTAFAQEETVEVTDITGTVTVPLNPERVVALDNRTFQTLSDWGIQVLAVPKDVMADTSPYKSDDSILNIGNHREPNLELIAACDPQLVILGQRFVAHAETIRQLVPQAAVIDLTWNVSEDAENPGENLINGFKTSTETLGKIFQKEEEAQKLIADFDAAIANLKAAYNGKDTIMSLVVSGGKMGFSAPGSGRVWGPWYEVFDWVPALEIGQASANHKGDDISVEAIAESDPYWIFVLDRDAATAKEGEFTLAKDVIANSEALKNIDAVKEGRIIYAPDDTYTNESIQNYILLFSEMAEKIGK
jgi:iron complex transport system substrate-binding protein